MEVNQAARCLEKLGNPLRLEVFRLLVRAGQDGLPVGEIQAHLGVPASTLSHHIAHLVNAGLVAQEREGRQLICRPDFQLMDGLIAFLTSECCSLERSAPAAADEREAG
ncbi:MAG TPA: ArsR family transcriptional regulator [Kiloniellaceae bacterium]|nr:ArsR family transcriptional regulator [Kiloniellaceae bacterium]